MSVVQAVAEGVGGVADAGSARARVAAATRELEAVVREVDPATLAPAEAVGLLAWFARAGKAASAGQAWLAGRVDDTGAARELGHRTTQDLVAARSGSSWATADRMVETGRALGANAATAEAVRSGRISAEQAHAIVGAATVVPSAEAELLAVAPTTTLRGLQRRARDVRLTAEMNAPGHYARMVAAQTLTVRTDEAGMTAGSFRVPPDVGAMVTSVLEAQADRHYRAASRAERHDRPHAWFRAEALTSLVTGRDPAELRAAASSGTSSRAAAAPDPASRATAAEPSSAAVAALPASRRPPRAEVIFHLSYDAYRHGTVAPGEYSVVQGVGPIPVERVRDVVAHDDPLIRAVLVEGTDITKIRTLGRHLPAELVAALTSRAITRDGAVECSRPGCDVTHHLQWDHRQPVHDGGPTSEDNIDPLCSPDHRDKTEKELRQLRARGRPSDRAGPDP